MNQVPTPARAFIGLRFPENKAEVIDSAFEKSTKMFHATPVAIGLNVNLDDEHLSDCRIISSLFPSKRMLNSKNLVYISSSNKDILAKISAFLGTAKRENEDTIDIIGIAYKTPAGTSAVAKQIKLLHKKKSLIYITDAMFLHINKDVLRKMTREQYQKNVDYVEIQISDEEFFFEHGELRERMNIFKENGITIVFSGTIDMHGLEKMGSLMQEFSTLSIMASEALLVDNRLDIQKTRRFYKHMVAFEREN